MVAGRLSSSHFCILLYYPSFKNEILLSYQAGPCLLGSAANQVLGRNNLDEFGRGEIAIPEDIQDTILGRVVILDQLDNVKGDKSKRFIDRNNNDLMVVMTDIPESNEAEKQKGDEEEAHSTTLSDIQSDKEIKKRALKEKSHYSDVRQRYVGRYLYGEKGLYGPKIIFNERIEIKMVK